MTYDEIAERLGCCRRTVQDIERLALRKLRLACREEGITEDALELFRVARVARPRRRKPV